MCDAIESAFVAISRLASGTEITYNLDSTLFPTDGLRPGELVEISGESNSGKSLLCHELIARIVLPANCGGLELGAVLIDCENSYSEVMLLSIMEKHIQNQAEPALARTLADPQQMERIQQTALKRLHLVVCYSLEQFEFSLLALPSLFVKHPEVTFVLIDSIATFYWTKCTAKNLIRQDTYQRAHCKTLRRLASKWKKVILLTRPTHFGSRQGLWRDFETTGSMVDVSASSQLTVSFPDHPPVSVSTPPIVRSLIDHRIELCETDNPSPAASRASDGDDQRFNAFVTMGDKRQYVRFYLIDEFGFNWLEA
ncbi:DNA repair protein XRCC2 [Anopheles funestus]|uniref:DNA repair protein XRCC2 n=1 Tax=Anopheles funestus TaxID=62324 RepID=UPI0020C64609|nr:DNA repair protein XRCC2 [Anopheles funestus]XP_049298266.1 DNA repair protein XRCC2 [Anopheles funestus]XP_049298267.1 DNA repair protein XRCC2 [Anopheles funestus]XP_049298268.1 DNA repair protein XRCC2 [Anopheles funestus]XP_049298269.1 DNA repair protein XRCC2 [Anopheles funestus]XP_049298270.1 DNA repair protein XRCC2 [Anopheles funestus]XP_049298271.1 DNA repair protein XRCC2 [Anopheles funestus]XP_049298272.1 DNA repair protein XRCC2 [Anopheles funestus]